MAFNWIAERVAAWSRYRRTVNELMQLNDRQLTDIGFRRDEIPMVAPVVERRISCRRSGSRVHRFRAGCAAIRGTLPGFRPA